MKHVSIRTPQLLRHFCIVISPESKTVDSLSWLVHQDTSKAEVILSCALYSFGKMDDIALCRRVHSVDNMIFPVVVQLVY